MKPKIDVVAEFVPYCAIGWLAEQTVQALWRSGFDVRAVGPVVDGQWDSHVSGLIKDLNATERRKGATTVWIGPLDQVVRSGHDNIVITGWETTALPAAVVPALCGARAVLVWGKWGAEVFKASKVTAPVHAFPLGVDSQHFYYDASIVPRRTIFLTAGRTAHGYGRKGVDIVMLAFLMAFPSDENVVLQVKIQPDCPITDVGSPRIQLIREWLAPKDMGRWYREGSVFVCASNGEGWSLHCHEALACGRPIIAPNFSGLTEFFRPDVNGWTVRHKLVPAQGWYKHAGKCGQIDIYHLAERMRYVHDNCTEVVVFGAVGAQQVAHLTIDNMHNKLVRLVSKYV